MESNLILAECVGECFSFCDCTITCKSCNERSLITYNVFSRMLHLMLHEIFLTHCKLTLYKIFSAAQSGSGRKQGKDRMMDAFGRATIRNKRQFLTRHWQVEYACSAALKSGTRGILRVNQCSPLLLLRIVDCYKLSIVTNCRWLRIVACYELLPHGCLSLFFQNCKIRVVYSIVMK